MIINGRDGADGETAVLHAAKEPGRELEAAPILLENFV